MDALTLERIFEPSYTANRRVPIAGEALYSLDTAEDGPPDPGCSPPVSPQGVGLYRPDDLMWRVNRETVLLLSGPRALLMQIAHPLVAAGVAQHSDFQREPLRRLKNTLNAMLGMIYGTHAEAIAWGERVNRIHESVEGRLETSTACFGPDTAYSALDPALLFWVQATLIDSAMVAYETFVAPLGDTERAQLYEESKAMAPLLRLPAHSLPSDYAEFQHTLDELIRGPILEVSPAAREIADAVLHPKLLHLPRALWRAGSVFAVGLLPPELRQRYGFRWQAREQRRWRWARSTVRTLRPLLPEVVRVFPAARRAEKVRRQIPAAGTDPYRQRSRP